MCTICTSSTVCRTLPLPVSGQAYAPIIITYDRHPTPSADLSVQHRPAERRIPLVSVLYLPGTLRFTLTPQDRPVSGAPGFRRPRGRRVRPLLVLGGLPCLPQAGWVHGRHRVRTGNPHDKGAPQGKSGCLFPAHIAPTHTPTHPHTAHQQLVSGAQEEEEEGALRRAG